MKKLFLLLLLFYMGCIIGSARNKIQRESNENLSSTYRLALYNYNQFKQIKVDSGKAEKIKYIIRDLLSCERSMIETADRTFNDMGTKVYENTLEEGFQIQGTKIPLATAYHHCKALRIKLGSEKITSCKSMDGNFYYASQGGSKSLKELVGLNQWNDSTCTDAPAGISPQADLSPDEIKKVNEICKGSKIIFSDPESKKSSKGGFHYYYPILCQKAPAVSTVSELNDYKTVVAPGLKECKNCSEWESAGASSVKPELSQILPKINNINADTEDE